MPTRTALAALCLTCLWSATLPLAEAGDTQRADVPGQKIDSGLGQLPHFRHWADRSGRLTTVVLGESLDDGLGALPHYSQWKDPSGRDPLGRAAGRVLTAVR